MKKRSPTDLWRDFDSSIAVPYERADSGQSVAARLTLWQQKLWGLLLGVFSGLALLLSALGLYGVISYIVKQRTFEFGIRIALGASRRNILAKVTIEALQLVFLGLALGFGLSFLLTRAIRSLLVAVTSSDPAVFISVPLLLTAVALVASLLPAYRAMSVQPWKTLRNE